MERGWLLPAYGERCLAAPRFHLLARRRREQLESTQRVLTVGGGEARQHRAHESRLQHFLCGSQALTGSGESHMTHASVGLVACARDVALALEPVDRDRHGGHGDAHVVRELRDRRWFHRVEVAENARLPRADFRPRVRVVDVPRVAGEVDLGVQVDEVVAGANGHVGL